MYVFLNTLPKSGSAYIWRNFVDVLNLQTLTVSENDFPDDRLIPEKLETLKNGFLTRAHADAGSLNVAHLEAAGITKIFVNMRHPIQVALSWHFHIAKVLKLGTELDEWRRRNLPDSYAAMNETARVKWIVEDLYPLMIRWICEWVDLADNNPSFSVLFGDYREMISDPAQYMNNILDFSEMDCPRFKPGSMLPRQGDGTCRKGSLDEYKNTFNPHQIRVMKLVLPEEIARRFEWDTH